MLWCNLLYYSLCNWASVYTGRPSRVCAGIISPDQYPSSIHPPTHVAFSAESDAVSFRMHVLCSYLCKRSPHSVLPGYTFTSRGHERCGSTKSTTQYPHSMPLSQLSRNSCDRIVTFRHCPSVERSVSGFHDHAVWQPLDKWSTVLKERDEALATASASALHDDGFDARRTLAPDLLSFSQFSCEWMCRSCEFSR